MQFKIGDQVVHPVYGTGQIVSVQEKQFSGKLVGLYYEVTLPKLITLWVPVETQKASRLRLATATSELDPPSDLPISAPVPLNPSSQPYPRGQASRLKQGLFHDAREVVRDLTAWGWRKAYRPERYASLAEDRAEPLSRMGDDS